MRRWVLAIFAATVLLAQDPSRGGASAVDPGGSTAKQRGEPESRNQEHAEAEAKQGEGHEENALPHETLWKWANFAILAAALGYLIRKNAGPYFQSRSNEILQGISEASKTRQEAEARAAEIESKVQNLSAEVESLRAQSRQEIAAEGERMRAESEAQLRRVQAQAEAEIESAGRRASHDLKAYSAQIALEIAERQLRGRISPPVQEQLAASFIQEIRQAGQKALSN